jgi:hypothetical protein
VENELYFENAKRKADGTLELQAKGFFSAMDQSKKSAVLELALKKWKGEMIFVHSGYNREIWKRDVLTGQIALIGQWDLNDAEIQKYLPKTLQTTRFHPFFFYIGGQSNFNSDHFSLLLSARIGSFLYKDRWDVALSSSLNITSTEANYSTNAELGLLSKVYFPIRKYNISPYVGLGITRVLSYSSMNIDDEYSGSAFGNLPVDSENIYWNKMLLIGVSWYVGPGSWDFGTQLGNNFNLTLGYTFSF